MLAVTLEAFVSCQRCPLELEESPPPLRLALAKPPGDASGPHTLALGHTQEIGVVHWNRFRGSSNGETERSFPWKLPLRAHGAPSA